MAPKRRRGDERQPEKPHAEVVQKASKQKASPPLKSVMVTRSSTRRLNGSGSTLADPQPEFSKPKAISKKKNPNPRAAKEAPPAKGNASKDGSKAATNKTIVIEHCKQCKSFLRRAVQVKDGLENDLSGITVLLNPEKPRRGCFEIREEGGDTFISLLNMKRPFLPMKELDMDEVISDIIAKIKS
ncbi:uncharacterized protein LOC127790406 isoform X2 [Diospyros lotus]|uniref:uncharacterized protein LOC127790406 isoform X2 n=1 Tax=Diospyros lotus TaxID=55363 RepID=UPI002253AA3F|nr:uncharacterized protein LOC127790406 isoform X2 [Diospyros lotus]